MLFHVFLCVFCYVLLYVFVYVLLLDDSSLPISFFDFAKASKGKRCPKKKKLPELPLFWGEFNFSDFAKCKTTLTPTE
jgi:hypothetical protein